MDKEVTANQRASMHQPSSGMPFIAAYEVALFGSIFTVADVGLYLY